jgi:hypothetical protein
MFKFNVHAKEWSAQAEDMSQPLLPTPPAPASAPKVYSEPLRPRLLSANPWINAQAQKPSPQHHNPWGIDNVIVRPPMWVPPPPQPILTQKVSEIIEDPKNVVTKVFEQVIEPKPTVAVATATATATAVAVAEPEKSKKKHQSKKKEVLSPPAEDLPQFPVPSDYSLYERKWWLKLCPPRHLARYPKFHNMSCIGEPRQMWLVRQIMKNYKFKLINTIKEDQIYMIQPLKMSKSDLGGMDFKVYFYKNNQIPFMIETDDSEFEEKVIYDKKNPTCIRKRSFYDYTYGKRVINETYNHEKKTKYIEVLSLPSFEKIETRTITGDNYIEDLY